MVDEQETQSMMVSQVIDRRAETCDGKRTVHGVWWEVDLGESTEIELIDVRLCSSVSIA